MIKFTIYHLLGLLLLCLSAGCALPPTVSDLPKQEFKTLHDPPVNLAVRGCRTERDLMCQVFLLGGNKSSWISTVKLKLADKTVLEPKKVKRLDRPKRSSGPQISLGFGFPIGGGRGGGNCPTNQNGHSSGSYGGVIIPVSMLLDGLPKKVGPKILELTYELGENQTCKGGQMAVNICIDDKKKEHIKDDKDTKASCNGQPENTVSVLKDEGYTVVFNLEERVYLGGGKKPKSQKKETDDVKEKTKKIVHEIQFTLKQQA